MRVVGALSAFAGFAAPSAAALLHPCNAALRLRRLAAMQQRAAAAAAAAAAAWAVWAAGMTALLVQGGGVVAGVCAWIRGCGCSIESGGGIAL